MTPAEMVTFMVNDARRDAIARRRSSKTRRVLAVILFVGETWLMILGVVKIAEWVL